MMRIIFRCCPLLLSLVLCFSAGSHAQDTLYWSPDTKMTWSDFRGKPVSSSPYEAITTAGIYYTLSYNRRSFRTVVYCYCLRSKSWSKDKTRQALLQHEQLHFDITGLYARKIRQAFAAYSYHYETVGADLKRIFMDLNDEKTRMNLQYDRETAFSANAAAQLRWQRKIAAALARPP